MEKVEKSCQSQLFPRLKPFWRPKSWKTLVLTTFPLFPRIFEEVFGIIEMVEKVVLANLFHDLASKMLESWKMLARTTFPLFPRISEEVFFHENGGKSWPGQLFPPFLCFQRLPKKFVEKVEKVGLANIFHDNFHCFWWLEASKPSEAIVPEIMEIMETVGFTNNFQDFCYQIHGN